MNRLQKIRISIMAWLLEIAVRVGNWGHTAVARVRPDAGQTVAEYALVLLVAAAIAGAFLLWARQSGKLDAFFDTIFEKLVNSVDPTPAPTP